MLAQYRLAVLITHGTADFGCFSIATRKNDEGTAWKLPCLLPRPYLHTRSRRITRISHGRHLPRRKRGPRSSGKGTASLRQLHAEAAEQRLRPVASGRNTENRRCEWTIHAFRGGHNATTTRVRIDKRAIFAGTMATRRGISLGLTAARARLAKYALSGITGVYASGQARYWISGPTVCPRTTCDSICYPTHRLNAGAPVKTRSRSASRLLRFTFGRAIWRRRQLGTGTARYRASQLHV